MGPLQQSMDMKSRRTSGSFFMPGRGPAAAARHDAAGGGIVREGSHRVPLCTAASGAELSLGAHGADKRAGQPESTSGQEAGRWQDAVFYPSLLDPVRHPAPFREVAHDSLILSCQLQSLWPFLHCTRATRPYLPPMPEGTPDEPGKNVCPRSPEGPPGSGCPGSAERGGAFLQTRGTGACAGAACGITLAGYAGPGDPGHLPAHASDCLTSPLR